MQIQHLEQTITGLGYEMWHATRDRNGVLRVTIDQQQGVGTADCDRVARHLRYFLPVAGIDYRQLEVSSPGLDRRLHKLEHFARFVGQSAKVTLRCDIDGQRNFTGVIAAASGGSVQLRCPDALRKFAMDDISGARLIPILPAAPRKDNCTDD